METHIRPITHIADEKSKGQMYWYYPALDCDAISATANTNGFTQLMAIAKHLNWDCDVVEKAAAACNRKREVCVVDLNPKLLLVPATKGQGDAPFLIRDLIAATRSAPAINLHFTHFGFMQGQLPRAEVSAVLRHLFSYTTSSWLNKVVIDIDTRVETEFYKFLANA